MIMGGDEDWKKGLTPQQLLRAALRDESDDDQPDLDVAAEALALGADVNYSDHGFTILMTAAAANDGVMIEWLLEHGARSDAGESVLEAARFDADEALRVLLARGIPMDFDEHGDTPLLLAAREGNWKVIPILLEAGADPDRRDDSSTSAREHLERAGRGHLLIPSS